MALIYIVLLRSITFGLSFTPLNPCPANLLAKVPNVSGRYNKYMLAAFERPLFKILLNLLAEAPPVVFQKNNWWKLVIMVTGPTGFVMFAFSSNALFMSFIFFWLSKKFT